MKIIVKKSLILGMMLLLTPCLQGLDYQSECENLFVNNKTNHTVMLTFCNVDHDEQQEFPIDPKEHRFVRVNAKVMKKLFLIRATIEDGKKKKKKDRSRDRKKEHRKAEKPMMKEIDYERDTGIIGLEINMKPDLDLMWRREEDYAVNVPTNYAP
jgi:hypothetical protein